MAWEVEYTDEFGQWWSTLTEDEQVSITVVVQLLERLGTQLPYPHSSKIKRSRHRHIRELRIQHKGDPYRVFYAFDPRRTAILLIGGSKTGVGRWYEKYVALADRLYDEHLKMLKQEGLLDD